MHYEVLLHNVIQNKTQCNTIAIVQHNAMQYDAMQISLMRWNKIQCYKMQGNTMQYLDRPWICIRWIPMCCIVRDSYDINVAHRQYSRKLSAPLDILEVRQAPVFTK